MTNLIVFISIRILSLVVFFLLGYISLYTQNKYLYLITLFLLIIYFTIYYLRYYFILGFKKEIYQKEKLISIITSIIDGRIINWSNFFSKLRSGDVKLSIKSEGSSLFNSNISINEIIEMLANQFYDDLKLIVPEKDILVSVSYWKMQNDKNGSYLSLKDPFKEIILPKENGRDNSHIYNYKFKLDDGTTASHAWKEKKIIIISNTALELKKSDPKFKVLNPSRDPNDIKSIICIPIFKDESFFGILSITSNITASCNKVSFFQEAVNNRLQPIISQIVLIEYVSHSFEIAAK